MMSPIDESEDISLSSQQSSSPFEFHSRFLEDFEPVRLLGRGAYGRVFEARKRIDEKHYAVKRIKLPANKDARAKVMREVTVLAELNHRNIVRYFHAWREYPPSGWQESQDATQLAKFSSPSNEADNSFSELTGSSRMNTNPKKKSPPPSFASIFGDLRPAQQSSSSASLVIELTTPKSTLKAGKNFDKYLYIQMELCRKESLAQWLETRQPAQDIYQMYQQILQAVAHLHHKGLIHRDLKPSNIFFAMDGTIKVGDLGLVKDMVTDENSQANSWNNERMQSVDFVQRNHTNHIGTRLYMSPEQVASKPYNHKVDVYALAVILFELLVPFKTGSERAHVIPELKLFRFPDNFRNHHSLQVEQLLMNMLSMDPVNRPEVKHILTNPCIKPKTDLKTNGTKSPKLSVKKQPPKLAKKKYYKLLVIGDQNTGKTSIIHRYVRGEFREKYEVTVGAGINLAEIAWNDQYNLTLEFFDIGGEERNRFMTSAFYRKAVGAFVVTDVTQPNGLEAATLWKKDLDLKLRMHDDSLVPCVLLINKCDGSSADKMYSIDQSDPTKFDRYCRQQNFTGWFDTSAKNNININEAVQFLVGKVLAISETSQNPPENENELPKKLNEAPVKPKRTSLC